jgi:hypothetical protein
MRIPKPTQLFALTQEENELMLSYINDCQYLGFSGVNNYSRVNEIREFFYRWHLNELAKKFQKSRRGRMVFVTLSAPEVKTLQVMFQRVDCDQQTINLQVKFSSYHPYKLRVRV